MQFTREMMQALADAKMVANRLSKIGVEVDRISCETIPDKPGIKEDTINSYWEFCSQVGLKRIDAFTDFAVACHLVDCRPETMYSHVKDMRGQVNKGRKARKAALEYLNRYQAGQQNG